jgi:hypothetical protein
VRLVVWAVEQLRVELAWAVYSGVSAAITRSFGGDPSYAPRHMSPEEIKKAWARVPGYDEDLRG